MKRDAHSHQELHPYLRVTARYIAEALHHTPGGAGPHGGSCGGYFSSALIRLCQLKVDVPGGGIRVDARHLGNYPVIPTETRLESTTYTSEQLAQPVRLYLMIVLKEADPRCSHAHR